MARAIVATLRLSANRDTIADYISDLTMQLEQDHRKDQYVPYTPGPEENWDYEDNSYTGLVRVQIGMAEPEDLASAPLKRKKVLKDQEIIRFEMSQLTPDTASLRIVYFEHQEEDFTQEEDLTHWVLDYFREYLRQIAETWPQSREVLRKQLSTFNRIDIFPEPELPDTTRTKAQDRGSNHDPHPDLLPTSKEAYADASSASAPSGTPPSGFPKTPQTREKWRSSYALIRDRRREYKEEYDQGDTEEPNPLIDDLRDALALMPEWKKKPSASTVRRIAKAGDTGWLN